MEQQQLLLLCANDRATAALPYSANSIESAQLQAPMRRLLRLRLLLRRLL
jgi:hypothetical protein